jgi:mannose-1-phosphate guanylyltransferase
MVLAAGKATRLRPLTNAIAKPALPFFGRAILDRVLDGLADAGVTEATVNLHHAPQSVRDLVAARRDALPVVGFSDETAELLGTGGALVPVRERFASEREIVLVNGDCVHWIDYAAILRAHRSSGADATLAVRARGERGFGALRVNEAREVVAWSVPSEGRPDERHFLSVQVISPRLFAFLPAGGSFGSFGDWYPRAQAAGCRFVVHETDAEWHALDSRELYLGACAQWLALRGLARWIDPRADVASDALVGNGSAVHARARVGSKARIEGSVLLPGARVASGASVERCVVGPDAVVEGAAPHPLLPCSPTIGA